MKKIATVFCLLLAGLLLCCPALRSEDSSSGSGAISVSRLWPAPGAVVNSARPEVGLILTAGANARLLPETVKFWLNGKKAAAVVKIEQGAVSYQPALDLPEGKNQARVRVQDSLGSALDYSWSFTVKPSAIASVSHSADRSLTPGSVLQVTMRGLPGGKAVFDIGGKITDQPMQETSAGVYSGSYTVKTGDDFQNAAIVGRLTLPGRSAVSLADPVPVSVPQTLFLEINSPQAGSTMAHQFVIGGASLPGAQISLSVKANLNFIATSLVSTEINADDQGQFQYQVNDWMPVGGGTYVISAVAKDSQGNVSPTVKFEVKRQ